MYMVGTRFARKHDPLTLARTMLGVDPFYRVRAERTKVHCGRVAQFRQLVRGGVVGACLLSERGEGEEVVG